MGHIRGASARRCFTLECFMGIRSLPTLINHKRAAAGLMIYRTRKARNAIWIANLVRLIGRLQGSPKRLDTLSCRTILNDGSSVFIVARNKTIKFMGNFQLPETPEASAAIYCKSWKAG